MKRKALMAVLVLAAVALAATSLASKGGGGGGGGRGGEGGSGRGNDKPDAPALTGPDGDTIGERTRSYTDCMQFAGAHKSRGRAADEVEFKRQFGGPAADLGKAFEYSYDNYTNVILDCTQKACRVRCVQK